MTASLFQVDSLVDSAGTGPVSFPFGLSGSFSIPSNVRAPEGAGTTTLTVADNNNQVFNLTANHVVKLPTTGVNVGAVYTLTNANPFKLAIQASNTSLILNSYGTSVSLVALITTPVASTDWAIINQTIIYGAAWQAFTPTYTNGNVDGSSINYWQRSGLNSIVIRGDIGFTGAAGHTILGVSLPNSFTFLSAGYSTTFGGGILGTCNLFTTSSEYTGVAGYLDTQHYAFYTTNSGQPTTVVVYGDTPGVTTGSGISYQITAVVSDMT